LIGPEFAGNKNPRIKDKEAVYGEEGVLKSYKSLRKDFGALLIVEELPGIEDRDTSLASKCAQRLVDNYLLKRSRGKPVKIPMTVHLNEQKQEVEAGDIELYEADDSTYKPTCSENEKLRWVFENMQVEGITAGDAPSIGTYTLLKEIRKNDQMRQKFYEGLWPKLLAKEDAQKTGKLEDTGKETIESIDRLISALPEKEV